METGGLGEGGLELSLHMISQLQSRVELLLLHLGWSDTKHVQDVGGLTGAAAGEGNTGVTHLGFLEVDLATTLDILGDQLEESPPTGVNHGRSLSTLRHGDPGLVLGVEQPGGQIFISS